jgi:hypothetical protein
MTLQLLHSEFPIYEGKKLFSFLSVQHASRVKKEEQGVLAAVRNTKIVAYKCTSLLVFILSVW